MTIRARCPHCHGELAFQEAEEGQERECDTCHGGLKVPRLVYYGCPTCHHPYRSSPHHVSRIFTCRECRDPVSVPAASTRASPQDSAPDEDAMVGSFGLRHVDRADFTGSSGSDAGDETFEEWFEDGDAPEGAGPRAGAVPGLQLGDGFDDPRRARRRDRVWYGGFFRRVAAIFIDGLILGAVQFAGGFVIGLVATLLAGGTAEPGMMLALNLAGTVVALVMHFVYFTVMEASERQATFGKVLLHMVVTDIDGNRLTYGRAALRYLGKIVSALICGIGFLMVAFTKEKQGLHDMIAGTYVVIEQ